MATTAIFQVAASAVSISHSCATNDGQPTVKVRFMQDLHLSKDSGRLIRKDLPNRLFGRLTVSVVRVGNARSRRRNRSNAVGVTLR
jgi:hypothetical protein